MGWRGQGSGLVGLGINKTQNVDEIRFQAIILKNFAYYGAISFSETVHTKSLSPSTSLFTEERRSDLLLLL